MKRELFDRLYASMLALDKACPCPEVDEVVRRMIAFAEADGAIVREEVPGVGLVITYHPHRLQGTAGL